MNVIESSKSTLLTLHQVISQLNDEEYSTPLTILSNSSIGMHTRHILEFYSCLFENGTEINYDKRQRNLAVQSSIEKCEEMLLQIVQKISTLSDDKLMEKVTLTNDEEESLPVQSCLARELQYNVEHTIHHSALLKIGIISLKNDIEMPETFGVAPSTLKYQLR
jgi:uncharacterized damage-inducible protein DinB